MGLLFENMEYTVIQIPRVAKQLVKRLSSAHLDSAYHFLTLLGSNHHNKETGEPEFLPISKDKGEATYGKNCWKVIKKALLDLKLIESNGSYSSGRKSKGYRVHPRCWPLSLETSLVLLPDNVAEYELQAILRHYTDLERKVAKDIENLALPPERLNTFINDACTKSKKKTTFSICLADAMRIEFKAHRPVARAFSNGRMNHTLTMCKKEMRKYLTFYGEEVVILDIVNAQPFFAACVIGDEEQFLEDTRTGVFYEKLMKKLRWKSRDKVKKEVMACIYRRLSRGKNGTVWRDWQKPKHKRKRMTDALNALYPKLLKKIDKLREGTGSDNGFAIMMQLLESKIMIDGVLATAQTVGIPAIPIHDGILVRRSDAKAVMFSMLLHIHYEVGCVPVIDSELANHDLMI